MEAEAFYIHLVPLFFSFLCKLILSVMSNLRVASQEPLIFVLISTVQDIVFQLQRFVSAVTEYHENSYSVLKEANVFPIEVDLTRGALGNTLK